MPASITPTIQPPTHSNRRQYQNRKMDTQVIVALVGGGFAVVVALIGKINHDNKRDHGIVHRALGRIEEKIDGHVKDHK
jgi:hypothetical protein